MTSDLAGADILPSGALVLALCLGRSSSEADHEGIEVIRHDAVDPREDGVDEVVVTRLEGIRGHVDDVVLQVTCRGSRG